jgi:MazG family protein
MNNALIDCYNTIKKLRDPVGGCPWDLEQTHQSLIKYMIEEAYELAEAINSGSDTKIKDELGDVLLQVFLHSILASEKKHFEISDVANNLKEKIIRRHPHVFNPEQINQGKSISSQQVVENWAKIKNQENSDKKSNSSVLKDWSSLPSLMASYKIGQATKKVNFDWENHSQVAYKVEEEWQELKEELVASKIDRKRVAEEMGDLLFSMAQLARHLDIEPEEALAAANRKFSRRFSAVEKLVQQAGKNMENMTQSELDHYWNQVKFNEKA